jgi:hypothetical protein
MYVHCDVFHIVLPPSPVSLSTDAAKYIAFILIRMTVMHFSRLRYSLLTGEVLSLAVRIKKGVTPSFDSPRAGAKRKAKWIRKR